MSITREDIVMLSKIMPNVELIACESAPIDCDGTCKGSCENNATND